MRECHIRSLYIKAKTKARVLISSSQKPTLPLYKKKYFPYIKPFIYINPGDCNIKKSDWLQLNFLGGDQEVLEHETSLFKTNLQQPAGLRRQHVIFFQWKRGLQQREVTLHFGRS